jgi:hypothetical protein
MARQVIFVPADCLRRWRHGQRPGHEELKIEILKIPREAEQAPVTEVANKHGISDLRVYACSID